MFASMGKISSGLSKAIYECSNKKTDFSKAISLSKEFAENSAKRDKPTTFSHTYPGIIYFNGWGNVKQDQKLAYELFNAYDEPVLALGYLAYMNHKGIVIEQNQNKGKGLTIELAKKIPVTKTQKGSWGLTLLCGGINYNFIIDDLENENEDQDQDQGNGKQVKEYRSKLGQCLFFESEHEVSIKFLEDYIFNRVSDFFQNPELVKTLNYLGEPQ